MGTPHDLYERYAADVYRFALYLSGNPAEAEDIAADTFVRLWTAPGPICGARAADGLALQVHRQDDRLPQRRLAFVAARRVEQPRHHRSFAAMAGVAGALAARTGVLGWAARRSAAGCGSSEGQQSSVTSRQSSVSSRQSSVVVFSLSRQPQGGTTED